MGKRRCIYVVPVKGAKPFTKPSAQIPATTIPFWRKEKLFSGRLKLHAKFLVQVKGVPKCYKKKGGRKERDVHPISGGEK